MKKFITIMCSLLLVLGLTACDGLPFLKKEPEPFIPQPMSIIGTVESISENYVNVVNETFEIQKVLFEVLPEDLHIGTIVDISAETIETGEYVVGKSYTITYQPLQYIVGYTGEELVSYQSDYASALYQVKEGLGADATYKGRITPFTWTNSATLRNDKYTRHIMHIYASVLDGVRVSDVYEEYATQHDTIMKYVNFNFGPWYSEEVAEYVMSTDMAFDASTVDVKIFEMKDDVNVNVEFIWDFMKDDNILSTYIQNTADKFGFDANNLQAYVSAEYKSATKDLCNINIEITGVADATFGDVPLSITNYNITVYGIEYNKEVEGLKVPDTVVSSAQDIYYLDNPMEETPDFKKEELLCQSLLGKEQVLLDDIIAYTGYTDDKTMMMWGVDSRTICLAIKEWLNNYNTDTFMERYVTLGLEESNETLVSAGIVYSWLQPYGISEQDYAPAPTE